MGMGGDTGKEEKHFHHNLKPRVWRIFLSAA
jgi:hypothetical protein